MNNENQNAINIGTISTTSLIGVAFVVLKLTGVVGWSWWWVTAPFWLPYLLALIVYVIVMMIVGLVAWHGGGRG